jgi:hypothetical protein
MLKFNFCALLILWTGPLSATERLVDFTGMKLNETPPGFRSTVAGEGKPGDWKVILDEAPMLLPPISPKAKTMGQRPVLAQLSKDPTDEHYPLLIWDEEMLGDFKLSVRFKLVEGREEEMAGIAFRIQDEKNFYYIRASGLGNTFNFFKVVEGLRSAPIGVKVEIPKGTWHELALECKGNQIRGWLNGREMFPPLGDRSFAEGKIGFWTKSDSVSYFSDLKLSYTPKITLAQLLVRDALQKYPRLLGLKIFAASTNHTEARVIASNATAELGTPARKPELEVIAHSAIYYGKEEGAVLVTMPLHDGNGETVAAVKVVMKSFPGQTEKNAIARALPIIKQMETRVRSLNDLTQ